MADKPFMPMMTTVTQWRVRPCPECSAPRGLELNVNTGREKLDDCRMCEVLAALQTRGDT